MRRWSLLRSRRPRDYGLLTPVATLRQPEASATCERLCARGIRATCGHAGRPDDRTLLHVLVFPEDVERARVTLQTR